MFGDWAMLHDPAKSVIWTREEVAEGLLERTSEEDIIRMFEDIAAKGSEGFSQ